jgi:hypothetical protein
MTRLRVVKMHLISFKKLNGMVFQFIFTELPLLLPSAATSPKIVPTPMNAKHRMSA